MSKYHFFTLPNTTAPINLITFLFLTMLQIMYESMKVKVENILNTVFGWGENREDEKQREENRVENIVFHCLAKEGKCWGWKTREKFFSPGPTIFILPNQEENRGEKSALTTLLQKCPHSYKHNGYKHNNLSLKHL